MEWSLEDIQGFILKHLLRHPADAKVLMTTVMGSLDAYLEIQKNKRNHVAQYAMLGLVGSVKKDLPYPFMVVAAFHQFPKGVTNHSPNEVKFWNWFLERTKVEQEGGDFKPPLACREDWDMIDWWNNIVQPEIDKDEK